MHKILTFLLFFSFIYFGFFSGVTSLIYAQDIGQDSTQETAQGTNIVVERLPESSIAYLLLEKVKTSWPWYVTRASGLVAGLLLVILMLSGSGFITGSTFRFLEPITAWATHRALGIALVVSVVLHIVALYFDTFVHFGVASLLVPFVSDYKPVALFGTSVGSLYVALGVLALYVFLAVVLTSLFWIDKKPHTWKSIHILSYLGMVFVFVHALYLGTDLAQGTLRYLWVGLGILVTFTSLLRIWRVKTV